MKNEKGTALDQLSTRASEDYELISKTMGRWEARAASSMLD
jgi:hypothetical protein